MESKEVPNQTINEVYAIERKLVSLSLLFRQQAGGDLAIESSEELYGIGLMLKECADGLRKVWAEETEAPNV